jgi:sulfur relay (sulfurtransferase) complex TusBCD TusD component (DsrE family)
MAARDGEFEKGQDNGAHDAMRVVCTALKAWTRSRDAVKIFLVGKGGELDQIDDVRFNLQEQVRAVLEAGSEFLACGTCLKLRQSQGSEICPLSTLKDMHEVVRDSDKVLSF